MPRLLTSAGAVDHRAVMRRAWELMRTAYGFGHVPFASIGRRCFAWCLRKAWAEAKDEARRRAIPAEAREQRLADLRSELAGLEYLDDWRHVDHRRREIAEAVAWLAA